MPSGSHGGSSGSHGGFSGGGGHSSSSHSSGSYHYGGSAVHRGPIFIHVGSRRYRVSNGGSFAASFAFFVLFIAILFIVAFSSMSSSAASQINMIKEERQYYLNMITRAENNPAYMTQAKITDQFYEENYGKYYVTYEIKYTDDGGHTRLLSGYTFSIYTLANIPEIGTYADCAINCVNTEITQNTDSITVDYKNFELEDDGEYMLQINNQHSAKIGLIITPCVALVIIVLLVVYFVKTLKREDLKTANREESMKNLTKPKSDTHYCRYCHSKLTPTSTSCPNCGASIIDEE